MQCIQMQELVKETIDRKVDPDDSAMLYKSDVAIFVENLNKIIRKSFEIDKNVSVCKSIKTICKLAGESYKVCEIVAHNIS